MLEESFSLQGNYNLSFLKNFNEIEGEDEKHEEVEEGTYNADGEEEITEGEEEVNEEYDKDDGTGRRWF